MPPSDRKLSPASSEPTIDSTGGGNKVKQGRRRGRPADTINKGGIRGMVETGLADRLR